MQGDTDFAEERRPLRASDLRPSTSGDPVIARGSVRSVAPALGLIIAACALACGRAPSPVVVSVPTATNAPDGADAPNDRISTAVLPMPASLVLDGDLSEWGWLAPEPQAASSHVAIAITNTEVAIAAHLRGGARGGIWLGVRFMPAQMPRIGGYDPLYGVQQLECDDDAGPECAKLLQARDVIAASAEALAVRVYRIDADGIVERHPGGTLVPVTHADPKKVHVRAEVDRVRVEAELPLGALPCIAMVEITEVGLAARLASQPVPVESAYVVRPAPARVRFEPMPALRASADEALVGIDRRFVYQPGSPDVRVYAYVGDPQNDLLYADTLHVQETVKKLYTPLRKFGSIEIGKVLDDLAFGILKDGKPLDVRRIDPVGFVERDGELHVFCAFVNGTTAGTVSSGWQVLAIAPDGKLREDVVDEPVDNAAVRAEPFHADDFSSFGFERTTKDSTTGALTVTTLVWRYDAEARRYFAGPGKRPPKPKKKR